MSNPVNKCLIVALTCITYASCKIPELAQGHELKPVPAEYANASDTVNTATIQWRDFFADKYLARIIDTALKNNQELLITLQEIEIARNDIRAREGKLLPFVAGVGG